MKKSRLMVVKIGRMFFNHFLVGDKVIKISGTLPEDAVMVNIEYDVRSDCMYLLFSSKEFPTINDGTIIPEYDKIIFTDLNVR